MMFFRKTAQPTKEKQNAYITTVADEYLKHSFRKLDDKKLRDSLKGKFASLKYTLSGFDPSNLSYKEKLTLLSVLYDLNIEKLGKKQAVKDLEMVATRIKDRLGVKKAFEKGIQDLPEGVFEMERLEGMTKEGLEDKAKELVSELEKIKSLENRSTEKQTSELSSERDMLEAVLYNISDGVFALDRAGEIITFNKAMEELTGYRLEEVENKNADEFIRIFDASEPIETRFYCAMPDITPEPKGFTKDKITLVTRDGQKKYVKMTSVAIYESRQVNVGCIVTFKDITKEIDLESMKLDFVSMAAHELRTPLTIMRGYLSLLMDEAKDSLKEEYADYLEKTTVSSDQLHVLIENLLNISKIERGTLVLEKTKQNWVKLVKDLVEQFVPSAAAADLTLSFVDSKSTIPDVYVDKTTIVEVLSNLLDNSIRYTPASGRISVFVEESDGQVITHIKDTGVGIPQASIPHIFKKFYRVSTVLKEGKKGTGLGLYISKEIVKLHKGDIWVESKQGGGSTFSFSLPVAQ